MISIEPVDAVLGAKVTGLSLSEIPDSETIQIIEVALERYGVLIFPQQEITPQQQIDFSAAFADLELTELEKARLPGYEAIFVVGNVGMGLVSFAPEKVGDELEWHTDHIHRQVAARASLLYALEVPEQGGDTLFSCMYHAYDSLTEQQKSNYCKLQGINSAAGLEHYLARQKLRHSTGSNVGSMGKRNFQSINRPLVREHPLSKRRALYFGNQITMGIVGWDDEMSAKFIDDLTTHACQSAFQYRHKWKAGDAVLWDNRRVLHAGTPYDTKNSRRHMHRTTWKEDQPIEMVN